MNNNRRKLFFGFTAATTLAHWHKPIINTVILPAHAETSECLSLPTIPEPFPDVTVSDNGGNSPIDRIDISIFEQCSITEPTCTNYTAAGLPTGLSISSSGIISGTYNASGDEVFNVEISAVLCGAMELIGSFSLTITDAG